MCVKFVVLDGRYCDGMNDCLKLVISRKSVPSRSFETQSPFPSESFNRSQSLDIFFPDLRKHLSGRFITIFFSEVQSFQGTLFLILSSLSSTTARQKT